MKSFTVAAALLASAAVAQPHGHHHGRHLKELEHDKRELVIEIETEWVTATVIIGDGITETVLPTETTSTTNTGGEFFEPTSTTTPLAEVAPTTTVVPPAAPTTTTQPPPEPTTTTTEEPPAPTTTVEPVVPTTTSTEEPVVPTTTAVAVPPVSGANSHTATGDITYYDVGMGACGYDDSGDNDTKHIVAISSAFWETISSATNLGLNMPAHPLCDQTVTITANGNTITAVVRDKCPGCDENSIDVTPKAYEDLFGSLTSGRNTATWSVSWN